MRRHPLAVVVAAGVLLPLLAGCGAVGSATAPNDSVSVPAAASGRAGDLQHGASASVGEADVIEVAVGSVVNGQALLDATPAEAERLIRASAAADTADAQVADVLQQRSRLHGELDAATDVLYWQAVLAVRVLDHAVERATVAVWHVGVLSAPPVAPLQAAWQITTVELVSERGAWRILTSEAEPGPTPVPARDAVPARGAEFDDRLVGFAPWPAA